MRQYGGRLRGWSERYFAGHSKWANIKHKKARRDADRQKAFIKLLREVEIAAKGGVGDENFRLTSAIQKAKTNSVPNAKIDAAVERGVKRKGDDGLETVYYEGHTAGGVAVLVETCTDNKKRTAPNMRHIFSKYGGNLGDNGSVSWLYEEQVRIGVPSKKYDIETILDIAVEAGASDVLEQDEEEEEVDEEDRQEEHVVVCTWCSSAKRENLNDLTLSCYHDISSVSLMSFVSLIYITRNSNTHLNITKTDLALRARTQVHLKIL